MRVQRLLEGSSLALLNVSSEIIPLIPNLKVGYGLEKVFFSNAPMVKQKINKMSKDICSSDKK
jgi:hypothetical protein